MRELSVGSGIDSAWGGSERIALITSLDRCDKANIITVGCVMRANMNPPVFAIGLGKKSSSCTNIDRTGEFVLAIPGLDLAAAVVYCGTHSGSAVDKFKETGLTAIAAKSVQPPLIAECLTNLECRVTAAQDTGDHRVFFGEVLAHWSAGRPGRNLLLIGKGRGYELVHEEAGIRLGAVAEA